VASLFDTARWRQIRSEMYRASKVDGFHLVR
jgi:hypothetical protein